ncbi:ascorbate-dependent monooxygenase [bacterium]|nr:ascorbate-dependent monooxygenase [bacterium]
MSTQRLRAWVYLGTVLTSVPTWGGLPTPAGEKVTFHKDVAPILYQHCATCHREGEVAPFSLLTYQDAAKRAEWLAENVSQRRMPPWKAEQDFGHFQGERRLTPAEIDTLVRWSKNGAPEGDAKDAPPTPTFASGWGLGEPDLILEAPHDVAVPADGPDIFHHWIIDLKEAAGREVSAVEFRPGNPRVVHHAVVLLDPSGLGRSKDALTPEPGYLTTGGPGVSLSGIMTIWAPGVAARHLPEHVAIAMPEKGDIVVQLHLHPSGKAETDRSRIGIYFSKKPAERHIMSRPFLFGPVTIDLPAGNKNYPVETSLKLPVDLWLTAVLPHMHLLGKEMKVTATLADGKDVPLIWIRDWDFNWQDQYVYREPVHLPAGTVVKVSATYDNSADNPANPRQPPGRVLFGEETNDEMCLAIFQAYAQKPEDAERVRRSIIANVAQQLHDPTVASDVKKNLLGHLREIGQAELQSELRQRLTSVLQRK